MDLNGTPTLHKIAFIGNYLPRQCGIATFTTDLCESVAAQYPEIDVFSLAINDQPDGYDYPTRVRFEMQQEDLKIYRSAADFINLNDVDLVCVQHEFGIFGGKAGSHILTLLRDLRVPVVTTLHTILADPDAVQRQVMDELIQLSDRLIVMSQYGASILQNTYRVSPEKIDLIPHGIPDVPFVDPNFYKDKFHVEGKQVLLTFGLLSPNKGIEYVIRALPEILEHNPDVVYLVLGTTHPHVRRHQGENYRLSLENLAKELGVDGNVIFHNHFVSLPELIEFIGAADIYITPYLNPDQIVSGTLAYTVGAGKAVISTPYHYAEELLADGRGLIVPFRDPAAISKQVLNYLNNETERHATRKRAYLYAREMVWSKIARQYIGSFERAVEGRIHDPLVIYQYQPINNLDSVQPPAKLPPVNLDHLLRLTDTLGILQHAVFHVPNYNEGYTTDDNARALVLTLLLEKLVSDSYVDVAALASRYLAFLGYAFNPDNGRFRNFLGFDRRWKEEEGSEDSHGRALWSLGAVIHRSISDNMTGAAATLFDPAVAAVQDFTSPRSWAFTLLGIYEYLCKFPGDRAVIETGGLLAEQLMTLYRQVCKPGWYWFEDYLTYNNATLPHALLLSSRWMKHPEAARMAFESLRWLADIQTAPQGHYIPVGNRGFYQYGGEKARFDQQPIEASAMVSACLEAYRATGEAAWYHEARRAFNWFLGQNDLGLLVYDPTTGGCRDGLQPDRVNNNQGAESTLAFLLSLSEMSLLEPSSLTAGDIAQAFPPSNVIVHAPNQRGGRTQ